jgi:membrane fusion protein (multidrug efflux system)
MMRKLTPLLPGVALVTLTACSAPPEAAPPAPPAVQVVEPVVRDVPVTIDLVGQALGSQDVEIRARVEGFLETMSFTEGSLVRKGQVLYRIDPKPFQADLANQKANLATWQARLEKTTNDVRRLTPLVKQQAVSQMELDDATSARDAAAAQVDAQKAAVDRSAIDLGYTTITAPVDGLVGTTNVKAGNLVGRGESTLLTTISVIDPILVRVGIAEAEYLRIARMAQEQNKVGTLGTIPVQLLLADGTRHPHEGRFNTVERAIDPTTGTLALQIAFPNPQRLVRPGQYARVRFDIDTKKGAVLVPQRAVQELQNLYSVAVVGSDNKVSFRNVKVGQRFDSLWVIEEGLTAGEKVIVEGLQRVREGTVVNPTHASEVK